jgi:hypothetical protein
MATLPNSLVARLEFFETRLPMWTADPTLIGLTLEAVTDLQAFTSTARNQWDSAQAARVASKGSTENFYNAMGTLSTAGSAALAEIRAFAKSTQNPDVYAMAGIPSPASPTPAPPPAAPTDITLAPQPNGAIIVKWKITQPAPGAEIQTVVQRRIENTGAWVNLGVTGLKTFTDSSVPGGSQFVSYMLHATRAGVTGPFSQITSINLGIPGNQGAQGQSGQGEGLTLAA